MKEDFYAFLSQNNVFFKKENNFFQLHRMISMILLNHLDWK